jgi:SAM-dependent methyltransferase
MTDSLKRYRLFGWDYPLHSPLRGEEVAWYVRCARRTGGPVLDVPCGTGRLLCRIAEAGFEVTGIDLCEEMLELARRNVFELTPSARERVSLVHADMTAFDLEERFGLVYIADNSFRELETRKARLACLRRTREHLREDGIFLMTERRFDPSVYVGGRRELDWSAPVVNPLTGDAVRRRMSAELLDGGRRLRGEFIYEITRPDGSTVTEHCPIDSPILGIDDYLSLFDEAGFSAEAFADYADRPVDGTEKLTCFVCRAWRRPP